MWRLADHFRRPVHELIDTMPAWELRGWMEWRSKVPAPEDRIHMQVANVSAVLANVNRDPKRKPEAFSVSDFLLFGKDPWSMEERINSDRYSEVDKSLMKQLMR